MYIKVIRKQVLENGLREGDRESGDLALGSDARFILLLEEFSRVSLVSNRGVSYSVGDCLCFNFFLNESVNVEGVLA